ASTIRKCFYTLWAIGSHARLIAENPLYARLAELQFAAGGR
ncbi:TPA: hypothetical protein ACIDXT_006474, partial [Pseudomonas aeruginosa]